MVGVVREEKDEPDRDKTPRGVSITPNKLVTTVSKQNLELNILCGADSVHKNHRHYYVGESRKAGIYSYRLCFAKGK